MIILWIIAQWSTEQTTEIKELREFQNNKWTDAHTLVMQAKAELFKKNKKQKNQTHPLIQTAHCAWCFRTTSTSPSTCKQGFALRFLVTPHYFYNGNRTAGTEQNNRTAGCASHPSVIIRFYSATQNNVRKNTDRETQIICLSYTLFSLERGITKHSFYMFLFHTLAYQTAYIQNHGA